MGFKYLGNGGYDCLERCGAKRMENERECSDERGVFIAIPTILTTDVSACRSLRSVGSGERRRRLCSGGSDN